MELSVTEYAKRLGVTRSAVLLQIKEKRLPKNVTVKKIGNTYSLTVRGQKNKKKSFEMLHNVLQIPEGGDYKAQNLI